MFKKHAILGRGMTFFLAHAAKHGNKYARDTLLAHNQAFLASMVKRFGYSCKSFDLEDLMQEANIGFMRAIELYDLDSGNTILTYAYCWVKQHIRRFIDNNRTTVRIPVNQLDIIKKYNRIRLSDEEIMEISKELNVNYKMLRKAFNLKELSLDEVELYEYHSEECHDFNKFDYEFVLNLLNERERRMLEMKLNCFTLDEISKMEVKKITRERVRQIIDKAIEKLKVKLEYEKRISK